MDQHSGAGRSREMRTIPYDQLPPLSQAIYQWKHQLIGFRHAFNTLDKSLAEEAGLSALVFSRLQSGFWDGEKSRITPPVVLALARLFAEIGVTLEMIIERAGYGTFGDLCAEIAAMPSAPMHEYIQSALRCTQTDEWRQSQSPIKERATLSLALPLQPYDKAITIAFLIGFWIADPLRELPRDNPEILARLQGRN